MRLYTTCCPKYTQEYCTLDHVFSLRIQISRASAGTKPATLLWKVKCGQTFPNQVHDSSLHLTSIVRHPVNLVIYAIYSSTPGSTCSTLLMFCWPQKKTAAFATTMSEIPIVWRSTENRTEVSLTKFHGFVVLGRLGSQAILGSRHHLAPHCHITNE